MVEVVAAYVELGQRTVLLEALAEMLDVLATESCIGKTQLLQPPVLVQVVLDVPETIPLFEPIPVQEELLQRLVGPNLPTQPFQPHRSDTVLAQMQPVETGRQPVLAVVSPAYRLRQGTQAVPVEGIFAEIEVLNAHTAEAIDQVRHAFVTDFVLGKGEDLK